MERVVLERGSGFRNQMMGIPGGRFYLVHAERFAAAIAWKVAGELPLQQRSGRFLSKGRTEEATKRLSNSRRLWMSVLVALPQGKLAWLKEHRH
jgi:hypothetical protein